MTDSQGQGFNWGEFTQKTWVVVASIIFFPPLGLVLLWRHPVLGKQRNWWIGACIWGVLWVVNVNSEQKATKTDAPDTTVGQLTAEARTQSGKTQSQPTHSKAHAEAVQEPPKKSSKTREEKTTDSAPERGSSAITNKTTGKLFSGGEMKALYKKAKTLKLGMSEQEVVALLGTPTETSNTDYSKIDVPNSIRQAFPHMNQNPDPMDIYTWSLKGDPGNSFIMVSFQRGMVQRASVYEGKSNKTFDLR